MQSCSARFLSKTHPSRRAVIFRENQPFRSRANRAFPSTLQQCKGKFKLFWGHQLAKTHPSLTYHLTAHIGASDVLDRRRTRLIPRSCERCTGAPSPCVLQNTYLLGPALLRGGSRGGGRTQAYPLTRHTSRNNSNFRGCCKPDTVTRPSELLLPIPVRPGIAPPLSYFYSGVLLKKGDETRRRPFWM